MFVTDFARLKELYGDQLQAFQSCEDNAKEYQLSGYYKLCAIGATAKACKEVCKQDCVEI